MRRLDESSQCLVAAPSLVAAGIASPPIFEACRVSIWDLRIATHAWQLHHADGQVATIPHAPRLVTDDMSVLRNAAIAGVGAVQLPTIFIWEDVRAGRLAHVLPEWRPRAGIVHAVFPSRRGLLPSVRVLVDFLAQECSEQRAQANRVVAPVGRRGAPE